MYMYSEDKWTNLYFNQLQSIVQTIHSRANRVTKLKKNDKKGVPYLISITFQASAELVRRPNFYVKDFVRVLKVDLPFRKGSQANDYQQSF